MRKLTYLVATSFHGFVSREDGGIDDFTFEGEHVADLLNKFPETIPTHVRQQLNISQVNQRFDTVLMGRHTYEVGQRHGIVSPYGHLNQYLFSTTISESPSPDVTLINENAIGKVQEMKKETGKEIWLCGGPKLASELIAEIDSVVLKINPFLMGKGKSIFSTPISKKNLHLISSKTYSNGFSLMEFDMNKG